MFGKKARSLEARSEGRLNPPNMKRLFRFSIRTLLVVLTALAVWLGIQVNRARNVRLAVEAVEDVGGVVRYVHERTKSGTIDPNAKLPGPAWLRELIGDEYFVEVAIAGFGQNRITNDELKQVCKCLENLQHLECFVVRNCSSLSDISALHKLSGLQLLILENCTRISDFGPLTELTNLQTVHLVRCPHLSDANDLQRLTNLQELYFDKCDNLTEISALQHLTNLRQLDLRRTNVTQEEINELKKQLPNCKIITN